MRIRQVRPEFFADGVLSRMSVGTRLTYVGLWCIADDAGWFPWSVPDVAAQLYPYESIRVRERRVTEAGACLVESGRLTIHEPCQCAYIPKLEAHQRIGGNKSFTFRDRHQSHSTDKSIHSRTSPPLVRYVGSELGKSRERANDDDLTAAFRRQGLPVDAA